MIITEENEVYCLQAMRVGFLTKRWEKVLYAMALMSAAAWGEKIDKQNAEYKKKYRLVDRYNV